MTFAQEPFSADGLFFAAQSEKSALSTGKITYSRTYLTVPSNRSRFDPTGDMEEDAYLSGEYLYADDCVFTFKQDGELVSWKMQQENRKDLTDLRIDIARRYGLDYNMTSSFDGQAYYIYSNPKDASLSSTFHIEETLRGVYGHQIPMESAGIPWMFVSAEIRERSLERGGEYRILKVDEDQGTIEVGVFLDAGPVLSATLSLSDPGHCLEERTYKVIVNTLLDPPVPFTMLESVTVYGNYKDFGGIQYPTKIHKEEYTLEEEIEEGGQPRMVTLPLTTLDVNVLDCEFNVDIPDTVFTLTPDPGVRVFDTIRGLEYKAF